jgi:hypothetical protein
LIVDRNSREADRDTYLPLFSPKDHPHPFHIDTLLGESLERSLDEAIDRVEMIGGDVREVHCELVGGDSSGGVDVEGGAVVREEEGGTWVSGTSAMVGKEIRRKARHYQYGSAISTNSLVKGATALSVRYVVRTGKKGRMG